MGLCGTTGVEWENLRLFERGDHEHHDVDRRDRDRARARGPWARALRRARDGPHVQSGFSCPDRSKYSRSAHRTLAIAIATRDVVVVVVDGLRDAGGRRDVLVAEAVEVVVDDGERALGHVVDALLVRARKVALCRVVRVRLRVLALLGVEAGGGHTFWAGAPMPPRQPTRRRRPSQTCTCRSTPENKPRIELLPLLDCELRREARATREARRA